jgi:pilus assembly protein Flp/PilA
MTLTKKILTALTRFTKDQKGATAIEYALIVAAIAIVIIGVLSFVGDGLTTTYNNIACALGATPTGVTCP